MKAAEIKREATAVIGSAVVLSILVLGLGMTPWIPLILAGATYLAVKLLWPAPTVDEIAEEVDRENLESLLKESTVLLHKLRQQAQTIRKRSVQEKVLKICDLVDQSLQYLSRAKQVNRQNRKLLDWLLEATLAVIERYCSVDATGSNRAEPQLREFEEQTLPQLIEAFTEVRDKLPEGEVFELSIGMGALREQLKLEGLQRPKALRSREEA